VHVYDAKIVLTSIEDNMYKFTFLLDNQPLPSVVQTDRVAMSFDDGGAAEWPIGADGDVEVYQRLPKGTHKLTAYVKGAKIEGSFSNEKLTVFDIYIRYGSIAIAVVIVFILLMKRKPKQKYKLFVPSMRSERINVVRMSAKEMLGIFDKTNRGFGWNNTPLTLPEIRYGLRKYRSKDREIIIMDVNLEEELEKLANKGQVAEHSGFYAPASWYRGPDEMRYYVALRKARDTLIENGYLFEEKGGKLIVKNNIITPYKDDSDLIASAKGRKRVIVIFENENELADFEKSLNALGKNRLKLSMLLSNGKMVLATVDKLGDRL